MPHSTNTWPQSHGRPGLPRRESWTSRFDPFATGGTTSSSVWAPPPPLSLPRPSADMLAPRAQKIEQPPAQPEQDGASAEHISMMLRSLGITPSPGPPSAPSLEPIRVDYSPSSITPPTLSPTTQIMSMESTSSVHTPTPARTAESLFTPNSVNFDPSLFDMDTPTKQRPRFPTASDEIVFPSPNPHSRKSTSGGSGPIGSFGNMAPRHAALSIPSTSSISHVPSPVTSHERVMSWMQRQGLTLAQAQLIASTPPPISATTPRQDWVFNSPQMSASVLNPVQVWDRPTPPQAPAQPRPLGLSASMWAPRPSQPQSSVPIGRELGRTASEPTLNEPINFLRLLQPSSHPPYALFVTRIVKNSDQQASIFLQQKLKAATTEEARRPMIDAIVDQGFDMMTNRFGNWAIQRCLEAPCTIMERTRVARVMKGRVIELATNCYGTHVVQKALDCTEEIQLFIVAEMLQGDLAATLMNKHASHVWTKIMELSWNDPAPPIFAYVNKAMQGRWADLARHETGSLIVQHAFENLGESDKADCVHEVLEAIDVLAVDQWGSWVVQHLLENGTENDRSQAVTALVEHIPALSTDPQGVKAIEKAIKSGGPQAVEQIVHRLSEPAKSGRRPLVVDLALSSAGSQLISMLLPMLNKAQGASLHDSVKGHIVTLKGSKSGSRVVWLFDRMKSQQNN
ncbi:Pumilio-family RNA binding repeat [Ceratobasidium sp. AG-Ba]|nr:Pumilio-family RNA binding repeat [Ceratobasidium sp. AG-Ba]